MSKNILLISEQKLKDSTMIADNVDPKQLLPIVKACQDRYIQTILGTALYTRLQSDVQAATVSGVYKTLLDDYITDCLLWYVLKELPMPLQYKYVNKGVMQRTSEEAQPIDHLNTRQVTDYCGNWAEWYADRLIAYLCANTASYPEYSNQGGQGDAIHPTKKSYSTPFAL